MIFNWSLFKKIVFSGFFYLIFVGAPLIFFAVFGLFGITDGEHFSVLADSFLTGKLYFLSQPSEVTTWQDTTYFNGLHYWPLGLFSAVIMLPFRSIFGNVTQHHVSLLLNLLNYFLLFLLARNYTRDRYKSIVLAFSYLFGSAYLYVSVLSVSWWFAHVVTTFCMLSSLYFLLVKQKPLLSGLFFGLAFLTRMSVLFGAGFYLLYFIYYRKDNSLTNILKFFAPVSVSVLIFFIYNFVRFGSILDSGYGGQILASFLVKNREAAMWGIIHFPTNLYLLFLSGPVAIFKPGTLILERLYASRYGMSMLFTSPMLLWVFLADFRTNMLNKFLLAGAVPIFLFLMGSFGTGAFQYGYRFTLDFQPFLYVIMLSVFVTRKVSPLFLVVTLSSVIFNIYILFMGLWPEFTQTLR